MSPEVSAAIKDETAWEKALQRFRQEDIDEGVKIGREEGRRQQQEQGGEYTSPLLGQSLHDLSRILNRLSRQEEAEKLLEQMKGLIKADCAYKMQKNVRGT